MSAVVEVQHSRRQKKKRMYKCTDGKEFKDCMFAIKHQSKLDFCIWYRNGHQMLILGAPVPPELILDWAKENDLQIKSDN